MEYPIKVGDKVIVKQFANIIEMATKTDKMHWIMDEKSYSQSYGNIFEVENVVEEDFDLFKITVDNCEIEFFIYPLEVELYNQLLVELI